MTALTPVVKLGIDMFNFRSNQNGQALLLIVLVMIIALTVGLSLISRSITSIKTSTEEANSQKALSAAEAGVEQSIKSNAPIGESSFGTDTKFETTITQVNGTSFLVNGGDTVQRDDSADVWLSDYSTESAKLYLNPTSASVTINFGTDSTPCNNPAVVVDVVSGSKASPVINKYSYDPCATRRTVNNFTPPVSGGSVIDGISFTNKTPAMSVVSGLFLRITPVYHDGSLGVTSNVALPAQGSVISSTGTTGTAKRKITVFQGFPKIPAEFFPYSLFSP